MAKKPSDVKPEAQEKLNIREFCEERIPNFDKHKLIRIRSDTKEILRSAEIYVSKYNSAVKAWRNENFPELSSYMADVKNSGIILGAISKAMEKFVSDPDKVSRASLDESGRFRILLK
jgi:hypothetical protein